MSTKIIIARVNSVLSSELLDIFNKFKQLVSANRGDLLSNSFSPQDQQDGFTAVLGFKDPKDLEALFKHGILNADIRVIDALSEEQDKPGPAYNGPPPR